MFFQWNVEAMRFSMHEVATVCFIVEHNTGIIIFGGAG